MISSYGNNLSLWEFFLEEIVDGYHVSYIFVLTCTPNGVIYIKNYMNSAICKNEALILTYDVPSIVN
jgi:hypothetical protein